MNVDARLWRSFTAVAEELHYSRAASYQALSLDGVRFVPVIGHQLTLQVAWAAGNTNTALPGFLETARQIADQTIPPLSHPAICRRLSPEHQAPSAVLFVLRIRPGTHRSQRAEMQVLGVARRVSAHPIGGNADADGGGNAAPQRSSLRGCQSRGLP